MIGAGWVATRSATLAVSRLDPPPTPTNPSNPPSTAKSAASCNDSALGSTRARSNTTASMPAASIASTTRPVIPASTMPGSLTTITRVAPRRSSSHPASAEAPGPNLIGVASRVKIVSLVTPLRRAYPTRLDTNRTHGTTRRPRSVAQALRRRGGGAARRCPEAPARAPALARGAGGRARDRAPRAGAVRGLGRERQGRRDQAAPGGARPPGPARPPRTGAPPRAEKPPPARGGG